MYLYKNLQLKYVYFLLLGSMFNFLLSKTEKLLCGKNINVPKLRLISLSEIIQHQRMMRQKLQIYKL